MDNRYQLNVEYLPKHLHVTASFPPTPISNGANTSSILAYCVTFVLVHVVCVCFGVSCVVIFQKFENATQFNVKK